MRDEFLRDRFVSEFHASWFITVERRGECLGTVVITIFEAHVRFHVAVVFHRQSGISNVVPVVRIVYLGEATFPNTRDIYVCHGVCNKLHKCGCISFDVETINNEFRI